MKLNYCISRSFGLQKNLKTVGEFSTEGFTPGDEDICETEKNQNERCDFEKKV